MHRDGLRISRQNMGFNRIECIQRMGPALTFVHSCATGCDPAGGLMDTSSELLDGIYALFAGSEWRKLTDTSSREGTHLRASIN